MKQLTYQQAEDKIFEAYFKDEIKTMDPRFCFCGTLAPDDNWIVEQTGRCIIYPYTLNEYQKMEEALFSAFPEVDHEKIGVATTDLDFYPLFDSEPTLIPDYEEKLFNGMCAALEVLKQIHIRRGEDTEFKPLIKRQLVK